MSTFNEFGLVLDRYSDVLARLHTLAREQWGDSIDLEDDSYDGHMYNLISLLVSEMNEIVQSYFDQGDISNASGTALDSAVAFIGLERQGEASSTIATVKLTSSKATTVKAGSLYGTDTNVSFATDEDLVFTAADELTVSATCTEPGEINVGVGELKNIITSTPGITIVENTVAAVPGRARQEDSELKQAHTLAVETSGDNDVASIYEALYEVEGVSAVYVFENDTNAAIGSIPAHNIYVVVIGGTDDDVATAIDNNKTSSVPTYGDENITVYNETTSQAKTINFDRGANKSVYVKMNITKTAGKYPNDGDAQIYSNLADLYDTKTLGDDAIYNELWGEIYAVGGLVVNTLTLGLAASPTGTSDLAMTAKERASLDTTRDDEGNVTAINVEIVSS